MPEQEPTHRRQRRRVTRVIYQTDRRAEDERFNRIEDRLNRLEARINYLFGALGAIVVAINVFELVLRHT